ncbi:trypsin-like peptidase domain-containing protein [Streptomyces sp. NPDC021093]|uniref:nSTAND1 domain-containing NTPase n=1 Tax=Streptomyces sp. NPDC021093 TaxID=3365112 RepID=UPI0037B19F14
MRGRGEGEPEPDPGGSGRAAATAAVARILGPQGHAVGTGFLVADDLVVTCAHVLEQAEGPDPAGTPVHLDFPHLPGVPSAEGTPLPGARRDSEAEDVAVLRLTRTPRGARPVRLGAAEGCRGHRVSSYGFPAQAPPGGHFGYGTAGDLLPVRDGGGRLLQLTAANDLTQGFSGGPVVDEVTGLVIGMITEITTPDRHLRGTGIAYATPSRVLREVLPGLTEHAVPPYRGLEPFTAAHAKLFHGRDEAVAQTLAALRAHPRVLLLLGPSGAGKSSLVQAGLLPALADGALPGSDRWSVVLARPGRDLPAAWAGAGLPGAATDGVREAVLRRLDAEPADGRLVLVADQFEEFLTPLQSGDGPDGPDPTAVESDLVDLIRGQHAVTVVLVMRDDFYPRLAAGAPRLLDAASGGLLNVPDTLSEADLHAIVTAPAHRVGLRLEDGLPERIVSDVLALAPRGTSARAPVTLLPPLELALSQLWERRSDGFLTHRAYDRTGGAGGSLAHLCDTALDRLGPAGRPAAERLLVSLVRPADETRHVPATRRRLPLADLRALVVDPAAGGIRTEEDFDAALAVLTGHRIVTVHAADRTDGTPGPAAAELIHDALLRDWPDLREWVRADHDFQSWLHRADERQARHTASGAPGDLLTGSDLDEGIGWARQRGLPPDLAAFVAAGDARRRTVARRSRRLSAGLALLAVLALIAAGVGLWQRHDATVARDRALVAQVDILSRQLAAKSAELRSGQPDLAALLAVQAHRTAPTHDAATSLYAADALPLRRSVDLAGSAYAVRFAPDGRTFATAGADGAVHLWDTTSGVLRRTFQRPGGRTFSVAFSPDGTQLAAAGDNRTARIWDTATGRLRHTLAGHTDVVYAVAFSPDGRSLVTGSADRTHQVWDAATGKATRRGTGYPAGVRAVAFSPDGGTLAASGLDGTVRLWDMATGSSRGLTGHTNAVVGLAFSPDGRTLATGSGDQTARLWNVATGASRATLSHLPFEVTSVAFSPDGRTLATGSADRPVQLWNAADGTARSPLVGHGAGVYSVTFSPDGRTLASSDDARTVRLWRMGDGPPRELLGNTDGVSRVAYSADGRSVASAGGDGRVRLWDPVTRRLLMTFTGHRSQVFAVAFSPDGRVLASGGADRTVRLWDVATGRSTHVLTGFTYTAMALAFSPDGRTLATGYSGRAVRLWDVTTGTLRRALTLPVTTPPVTTPPVTTPPATTPPDGTVADDEVASVAFSPDGRTLATGHVRGSDNRGSVRWWDLSSGKVRQVLGGHTHDVESVLYSPDGRLFASFSLDLTGRLWDVSTGTTRDRLTGFTGAVFSAAFSPDGHTLATASLEPTLRLWDVDTARVRTTLTGPGEDVIGVAFSPDGRTLATGGSERPVLLRPVDLPRPEALVRRICDALHRDFTAAEKAQFLPGRESGPVCGS